MNKYHLKNIRYLKKHHFFFFDFLVNSNKLSTNHYKFAKYCSFLLIYLEIRFPTISSLYYLFQIHLY